VFPHPAVEVSLSSTTEDVPHVSLAVGEVKLAVAGHSTVPSLPCPPIVGIQHVGVGVGVDVAVGVGVNVAVAVGVGVKVAVAVAVGVGDGQTTTSEAEASPEPSLSVVKLAVLSYMPQLLVVVLLTTCAVVLVFPASVVGL